MLPQFSAIDVVYRSTAKIEARSYTDRRLALSLAPSDLANLLICQARVTISRTTGVPILRDHVGYVVSIRPEEDVCRIHTRRIVAPVQPV